MLVRNVRRAAVHFFSSVFGSRLKNHTDLGIFCIFTYLVLSVLKHAEAPLPSSHCPHPSISPAAAMAKQL